MNGIVTSLLVLVTTSWYGLSPLDKSGTIRTPNTPQLAKVLEKREPAEAGSFRTEREGFSDRSPDAGSRTQQLLQIIQSRSLTSRATASACAARGVRFCHKTATTPDLRRKQLD